MNDYNYILKILVVPKALTTDGMTILFDPITKSGPV